MDIARSFFKKALGLMFKKDGEMIFVFNRDVNYSVWTPFMRFNIDIFFLDKDFNVVDRKMGMKPWRIYEPKKKYRYFFESREGKYDGKSLHNKLKEWRQVLL